MRITVSEQSAVRVGSHGAADALSLQQAGSLVDVGEQMGARVVSWQGPTSLRVEQFVGVVRADDLHLEILPKLDGLAEPAEVRKNLLAMLAVTQDLEVQSSQLVGFLESSEPFICALARLYCHRLLDAVRRGLRQDYVVHYDQLPRVRGKIDWPAQIRSLVTQRLEFQCIFDERSEDTPLNRVLKAALLRAGKLLEGAKDTRELTELRHAMSGVSDVCPSPEKLQRLQTDRMNRSLKPLLTLAKLILGNHNPDLGRSAQGDRNTYALVWDMNVLFEEYVGRVAVKALGRRGLAVDLQDSTHLARETQTQRHAFLMTPDILVRRGSRPWAVADTKWKRLGPRQANLGVSGSDVYQVLAYAHRYRIDQAILVYPHHPALGVPGVQREFVTQGLDGTGVRVRVLTVDLARLESVPQQMEQGFTGLGEPCPSTTEVRSPL